MRPLLLGAAALAGAGIYAAAWPRAQLFGRTLTGAGKDSHLLALTYDDGPNGATTERLLALLERLCVRATFFMIGRHADLQPDLVQAIARGGHTIGNHGYTHQPLIGGPPARIHEDLLRCQAAVQRAANVRPRFFRPPFGLRSPSLLRAAANLGLEPVLWSVTCFDWKVTTADAVARHAMGQIVGGEIILLHDGGHREIGADRSATIEATRRLIERYSADGFQFVTVDRLQEAAAIPRPPRRGTSVMKPSG